MAWLIACEESQTVCAAFRARGIEAFSCDLIPTRGDPKWHIIGDALHVARSRTWEGMIAHPPCTFLCNSGVRWLHSRPGRWESMRIAAEFFRQLLLSPVEKKAVENPIMHRYGRELIGRTWDQCVQPWMFGHPEQKATCLWLEGLPPLLPTDMVRHEMEKPGAQKINQRIFYMSPGPHRARDRSVTFPGIANAMAAQWGEK